MTSEFKQALSERVFKRIEACFPNEDDDLAKLTKTISDIAVKATIITLEEYETLKSE